MPTEKKTVTEFQTKPVVRTALRELGKRGSDQIESAEMREAAQLVFKLEEGGVIDESQKVAIIDLLRIYQDVAFHWRRFSIVHKTQNKERKMALLEEASQEVIETCAGLQYDQEMAIDQTEIDVLLEKIGLLNILLAEFGNEHEHNSGNTKSATAAAPSEQPKLSEEEEHLLELKKQSETLLALTQDLEAQLQNLQFDPRNTLPAASPPASYAEHLESLLAVAKNNATVLAAVSEMRAVTLLQKRLKPTIEQAEKVLDKAHARILELKTNEFIASQANFTQQVTQHTTALQAIPITPAVSPQPLLTACDQFLATLESNARAFDTSGVVWDRLVIHNLNGLLQERAIAEEKHIQYELRDLVSKIDSIIDVQGQPQPAVSTWTYPQANQERVDLETEETIARPILQLHLGNYQAAQVYIDKVNERLPLAKTVVSDRINTSGVAEYNARPEVVQLQALVNDILAIDVTEDVLLKGQSPKPTGRNLTLQNLTNANPPLGLTEQLTQRISTAQAQGLLDQGTFVYALSTGAVGEKDKLAVATSEAKKRLKDAVNYSIGWKEIKGATRAISDFFEGGYLDKAPSSWREGEWRTESPKILAKALWLFVLHNAIFPATKGDDIFMDLDLINGQVMLGTDSFQIIQILQSFKLLDSPLSSVPLNNGNARIPGEFENLYNKLAIEFSTISKVYKRGKAIYSKEGTPKEMIAYYLQTENRMDADDLQRVFNLGSGYGAEILSGSELFDDRYALGDRLLWAMQAYFAMNDPEEIPLAYIPSKEQTGYDAVFAHYKVQNPLSIYPAANRPANEILLKRYAVRQLIGSDAPPEWIANPLVRRVGTPNQMDETLNEFAQRQKAYIQNCIRAQYSTLAQQFETSGAVSVEKTEQYMTTAQARVHDRNWGYVPEQMADNIGEYALEPCKAEGGKIKLDNTGQRETRQVTFHGQQKIIPVIDVNAGPASIFIATRWGMAGAYRSKLTKETEAEGSPGPRVTLWSYGEFLPTMFDYYRHTPSGDIQGASLKELLLVAANAQIAATTPFKEAVSSASRAGSEGALAWFEAVKLSMSHYDRTVYPTDNIRIDWQNIRQFQPGSEAATQTFSPGVVKNQLAPVIREITYLMQRDYGQVLARQVAAAGGQAIEACSWKDESEHNDFLRLENYYVTQLRAGARPVTRPPMALADPYWDRLWSQVKDFNWVKRPDARCEVWDVKKPGTNPGNREIVRIASRYRSVVHIPIAEEMMNPFERKVCLPKADGSFNDHWQITKKLFFGNLIIGSIVSAGSEKISIKDIDVILQLMCEDYWRFKNQNAIARAFRRFRKAPELNYEGLGIFTEDEAVEMLRAAGVTQDILRTAQDVLETMKKFQITN